MEKINLRIKAVSKAISEFSELGAPSLRELKAWVDEEFGGQGAEVLDSFQKRGNRIVRAVPPERLLIIGAGNLVVSLWQSLCVGFLLGSQLWVKPGAGTEAEISFFLKQFPMALRKRVTILERVPFEIVQIMDAVVVLGSDTTIEAIQKNIHPKQLFVSYGHRTSAAWIGEMPGSAKIFDRIAEDISAYGQQGCLSPRWIWLSQSICGTIFVEKLAGAMNRWRERNGKSIPLSPTQEALTYELRETHRALGNLVYVSEGNLNWTIIYDLKGISELNDLPCVIFVRSLTEKALVKEFAWMSGDLSTVGVYGGFSEAMESIWIRWGVARICSVGKMQRPPVHWFHDGRPQLTDLVRWVEKER